MTLGRGDEDDVDNAADGGDGGGDKDDDQNGDKDDDDVQKPTLEYFWGLLSVLYAFLQSHR